MECNSYNLQNCSVSDQLSYSIYHSALICLYGILLVYSVTISSVYVYKNYIKTKNPFDIKPTEKIVIVVIFYAIVFLIHHIISLLPFNIIISMNMIIFLTIGHISIFLTVTYYAFVWISIKSQINKTKIINGLGNYKLYFLLFSVIFIITILIFVGIILFYDYNGNYNSYIIIFRVYWTIWSLSVFVVFIMIVFFNRNIYILIKKTNPMEIVLTELKTSIIFFSFLALVGAPLLALYAVFVDQIDSFAYRYIIVNGFVSAMQLLIGFYSLNYFVKEINKIDKSSSSGSESKIISL